MNESDEECSQALENPNIETVKIACVILAAGKSVRFGKLKQLALINGKKSMIQQAIDTANSSKADPVLLVVGSGSPVIVAKVSLGRSNLVYNKDYEKGLSSSIRCGVSNLPPNCEAAILMVADQPFLSPRLLDMMIDTYVRERGSRVRIVAMASQGNPRNPVLLDRALFPELQKLEGDSGAKTLVERHLSETKLIEAIEPEVFIDIDTEENFRELAKAKTRHRKLNEE
ncbi:MAG TPA: nucleotidyltransferase family protein [Nitrososphaerales archaeon]|nr:nucleotidyltransferase family protein [Nitrososphaerales archaeon]